MSQLLLMCYFYYVYSLNDRVNIMQLKTSEQCAFSFVVWLHFLSNTCSTLRENTFQTVGANAHSNSEFCEYGIKKFTNQN